MLLDQTTKRIIQFAIVAIVFAGLVQAQQIKSVVPDAARPLPLSAVRLTGGPLKRAQDLDAEYLLKLEPDRMLAFYRKRAGLEPDRPHRRALFVRREHDVRRDGRRALQRAR